MISRQAEEVIRVQKELYVPYPDWREMDYVTLRAQQEAMFSALPVPDCIRVIPDTIGDVKVEKLLYTPEHSDKWIFYVHGGGMTIGSPATGRFMVSNIAALAKRNVLSVDYRLSPEYAFPAALEDCEQAYRWLLDQDVSPDQIAFFGESAGGMLVISFLSWLRSKGLPQPGCFCTVSGSVDCEYKSQSMVRNADSEFIVNLNLKEQMKEIYYKDVDPHNPVVSPIYADLKGWPAAYLLACREEILLDESMRFYVKLEEAGVPCDISIDEGLFHCYMMGDMPESHTVYRKIADFFMKH